MWASNLRQNLAAVIPYSKPANAIAKKLESVGVKVAMNSGSQIRDMVCGHLGGRDKCENSVVYEIPCSGCFKTYVGETGRGVETRLKEHKQDVKYHHTSNAIVLHIEKCKHLPIWSATKILEKKAGRQIRKTLEAAHIATRDTFNSRSGFVTWALPAAKLSVGVS